MAGETDHQKEMQAHSGTYDFFIKMMTRSTIAAIVVTAIVIWLIVS
ncbi:MAG: hypothetical protein JWL74_1069 [Alphaproteobacteria bacterium]|jgi:hypothetical protein|nr:hypothetical protein [Alphaproteobacteria bacterium]